MKHCNVCCKADPGGAASNIAGSLAQSSACHGLLRGALVAPFCHPLPLKKGIYCSATMDTMLSLRSRSSSGLNLGGAICSRLVQYTESRTPFMNTTRIPARPPGKPLLTYRCPRAGRLASQGLGTRGGSRDAFLVDSNAAYPRPPASRIRFHLAAGFVEPKSLHRSTLGP